MKNFNATKLAVLGVSAIAIFGVPQSAKAADINAGTDYLTTPGDPQSSIDIGGTTYPLIGVPFDPTNLGSTDTTVERGGNCTFVGGFCTVPLTITNLNLKSVSQVQLPAFGGFAGGLTDVFVKLNGTQTTGSITINQSGTWTASLPINSIVQLPDGTPLPPLFQPTPNPDTLTGSGTYVASCPVAPPQATNNRFFPNGGLIGGGKIHFFRPAILITPFANSSPCVPVPEPSNLAALTVLGLGLLTFGVKRRQALK